MSNAHYCYEVLSNGCMRKTVDPDGCYLHRGQLRAVDNLSASVGSTPRSSVFDARRQRRARFGATEAETERLGRDLAQTASPAEAATIAETSWSGEGSATELLESLGDEHGWHDPMSGPAEAAATLAEAGWAPTSHDEVSDEVVAPESSVARTIERLEAFGAEVYVHRNPTSNVITISAEGKRSSVLTVWPDRYTIQDGDTTDVVGRRPTDSLDEATDRLEAIIGQKLVNRLLRRRGAAHRSSTSRLQQYW